MGSNGWRLMYSGLFNKEFFKLDVQEDVLFRIALFKHCLAEAIGCALSVVGCIYALIRQDVHSHYFAHSITFMGLCLAMIALFIVDLVAVKKIQKREKMGEGVAKVSK